MHRIFSHQWFVYLFLILIIIMIWNVINFCELRSAFLVCSRSTFSLFPTIGCTWKKLPRIFPVRSQCWLRSRQCETDGDHFAWRRFGVSRPLRFVTIADSICWAWPALSCFSAPSATRSRNNSRPFESRLSARNVYLSIRSPSADPSIVALDQCPRTRLTSIVPCEIPKR